MLPLLSFHKSILEQIHDPSTNDLLVIARGLGMRRIVSNLLKLYDSPQNLVLLVNATPEEESEIGEELGIMGCRNPGLRVVGYETGSKDRQDMYKKGGLISVTSRILVVDMLQSGIPTQLITGMVVLHAEKVTPLVLEAFIVRLYREKNKEGFLKAFTDQPEHITSGLSPLKNIMKELQLRTVHLYPRFQDDVKKSLERRRADVVELSQHMTESMAEIHHAIIQCMNSTLSDLKRSNASLDLDDLTVENAYFRSFDLVVRRQLDTIWHKVGPRTKQLVSDLGTLRKLLGYLLTYDPIQFYTFLETIVESNQTTAMGGKKEHHSPWLLTDAANVIISVAKRRCYIMTSTRKEPVLDDEDEEGWAALDEINGTTSQQSKDRPRWLPAGVEPILEELPKWNLLADVLKEIEEEMIRMETNPRTRITPGKDTVLVMASSTHACSVLTEFLESMDYNAPPGQRGGLMMMRKLGRHLWWKGRLHQPRSQTINRPGQGSYFNAGSSSATRSSDTNDGISEALRRKDKERQERSANRRRLRGGKTASAPTPTPHSQSSRAVSVTDDAAEADLFTQLLSQQSSGLELIDDDADITLLDFDTVQFETEFDANYGLLAPSQTVVVRPYADDADDMMLAELQPRFIIMIEPNVDFFRRVELYRCANPGLGVRMYHMFYGDSCEEHKFLAGIRKEKNAFERLIRERGNMLLPIFEDTREKAGDSIIKTISTRIAGGRRELSTEPSRVIVDMREFRSTLPSLLHASNLLVIPATLTVGDYILTPDICVERKSLSDLVSSFNSGRLYTQCEIMSVHYKHPILLIEFEEEKAFSLEVVSDMKSYAKPTNKYPPKKQPSEQEKTPFSGPSIQSKLVLLTLTFPRVRIIWSSSPYATSEIYNDLKKNSIEPDPTTAIAIGAEEDPDAGAGVNTAAEELLRCLPGITQKNVKYVASKINNVRELCEMSLPQVQELLGAEPGKTCWEFMHHGSRHAVE
ncbi:hypothetical protein BD626DRAFT_88683 [Schizophyllum amplum]|uniref:ERCC4 domain-containing protein n=1 Tax=Schizophyllum amplum TaxID=97359 RepID=A0A550C885_9AGAR|nr:hypothetical protein BD626DRAFT_88683 [Auriculariopsis ampla]